MGWNILDCSYKQKGHNSDEKQALRACAQKIPVYGSKFEARRWSKPERQSDVKDAMSCLLTVFDIFAIFRGFGVTGASSSSDPNIRGLGFRIRPAL